MSDVEMLLVGTKVRQKLKEADLRLGGEVLDQLNAEVHRLVERAIERAVANGRRTVRPQDM